MATLKQVRKFIAALPEAIEQDHHGFPSFRVAKKIFATLPDPLHLHIMLAEPEVRMALEIDSVAFQELRWGQRLSGVRVEIKRADFRFLSDLISLAWSGKAPKSLLQPPPATVKPGAATRNPSMSSSRIDAKIQTLGGWRARTLTEVRRLIHEAVPGIEEDCKWIKPTNPLGVPTWSCGGIVCTGEAYKQVVKLTFARGASLNDPQTLFNASLEGNTRRAIDIHEGELLEPAAFKGLVQAAVEENLRSGNK